MDLRVGYAGSRTRYPVGMYEYVHNQSGRHANLSGTAIIIQFITVSGIVYPETVFCYIQSQARSHMEMAGVE